MRSLKTLATTGLLALAISPAAQAADLFAMPAQAQALASDPVELGTGWYLRGDVGFGSDPMPKLSSTVNKLSTWSVDLGAGYKINDWMRLDATLGMREPKTVSTTTGTLNGTNIICPAGLEPISEGPRNPQTLPVGTPLGYLWDETAGTCNQTSKTQLRSQTLMLNAYFDLGNWSGLTPYVGAGVGVARNVSQSSVLYTNTADGSVYAPSQTGNPAWVQTNGTPVGWVDRFGIPVVPVPVIPGTTTPVSITTPPNWNRKLSSTRYNFAWSLMAGVAYDLSANAKLDIGYRYMNAGKYLSGPSPLTGFTSVHNLTTQEIRIGVRYLID